ncbi:MAG: hypothetical protein KGD59_14950 [Candidatus Heimdallarchaeota archaeon]|nr:hypothetical protein [Candidatus Heimdallarchaeota archaeon]
MRLHEGFRIKLHDKEILRLLRSENASQKKYKKPSTELLYEISELKDFAVELLNPRGMYDIFDSSELTPKFLFNKSEKTVLCICTVGKDMEEESSRLLNKGELAKGVILDAIASHAAEEVAVWMYRAIIRDISEDIEDLDFTNRFSPGYCQWSLAGGQKVIFNLLPSDILRVKLSKSMMMIPRKSVSFAVNIGKEVDMELGLKECPTCDLQDCSFRRD